MIIRATAFSFILRVTSRNRAVAMLKIKTLHETIFLATCNATMTTEKHCKLQRGCHTFAIFFATCNALGGNYKYMLAAIPVTITSRTRSDWLIVSKLSCKLQRGYYTQATCLATLRKVEGSSTSLATRNATVAVAKWGVTRQTFLATCNATFVALQVARKIASCNMTPP